MPNLKMHNLTHTTARILTGISLLLLLYAAPATAQVDDTAKRLHIFPQVADGGGWGSVLMAINTSSSETQCDFTLFGDLDFDRFQRYSETSYSGDSKATFSMLGNGGSYLWPSRNVKRSLLDTRSWIALLPSPHKSSICHWIVAERPQAQPPYSALRWERSSTSGRFGLRAD